MDDIYFSDKKRHDPFEPESGPKDFIDADYFDEDFNLKFKKTPGNAQSFISESENTMEVDISAGEKEVYSAPSWEDFEASRSERQISSDESYRRPQGRPLSQSRTPQGRPVSGVSSQRPAQARPTYSSPSKRQGNPSQTNRSVNRVPASQSRPVQMQPNRPEPSSHGAKGKKKISNKKVKIALSVVAVFAVILLALFGYLYSIMGNLGYDDSIEENRYLDSSAVSESSIKNILFIGSDARGDVEGQRSDTMILFSIDKKNKQIKLTSFLRDSYVYIPYLDRSTKINAAFSSGGAQATIDTIEYNYGVDIDNYVMVNFDCFEQVVDLLGGIEVEVTAKEAKYLRDVVKIPYITEGVNQMKGSVALWYCRIRKLDSDFYRTARQRKVITAIISKATKTNPADLVNMVEQVLPNISTDLTRNELMSLGMGAITSYIRYDIVQQQMPADGTWWSASVSGSGDVIKFDAEQNRQILKEFLLNKVEEEEE